MAAIRTRIEWLEAARAACPHCGKPVVPADRDAVTAADVLRAATDDELDALADVLGPIEARVRAARERGAT